MKTRLISMLLALAMMFSLVACGSSGDTNAGNQTPNTGSTQTTPDTLPSGGTDQEPAAPTTVLFTDDAGRQVEIPAQINGLAASSSLAQIILLAIAPEMFVGLADAMKDTAKGIVDDKYFDLPKLGSLYATADLNVEALALAGPDILIDIGDNKEGGKEEMDKLQMQTNIPSVFIHSTLETMPETYRTLGKLLGKEEKGEQLAKFCERVYDRTVSVMEQVGDKKVNALYVLGEEGLNVIAATSYHAELLDLLTNNLAVVDNPISKGSGNEVTMEQIALWNPDFVIFGPGSIYSEVENMDAWSEVTAIVNCDYVEAPDKPYNWMSMPPSVQRYLSLIWLTAELYPDYCDYDVKVEIFEFFDLFFGCQLTEEQYADLSANLFRK